MAVHVHRLYAPIEPKIGVIAVKDELAHRLLNVLRLRVGDAVLLTDGKGNEMQARVIERRRDKALVEVCEISQPLREPKLHICVAAALLRGERFEWLIQKVVELGAREIMPLLTRKTVVRISQDESLKKQRRWLSIAISAMEQSGGCVLPIVHQPLSFDEALHALGAFDAKVMLHERARLSLHDAMSKATQAKMVALLTGPEGGFEDAEVEKAISYGTIAITLGKRILRAETAAIVGTTVLLNLFGELG